MVKKEVKNSGFIKFWIRIMIWIVIYLFLSLHFSSSGFISFISLIIAIFVFFGYTITRGA